MTAGAHPVRHRRRRLAGLLIVAAAVVVAVAVPITRHLLLRCAGWTLVVDEPIVQADVIVISTDAHAAGVLEAADLVHRGVASRVALFPDPPDAIDREFLKRGVAYYNASAVAAIQLHSLGVAGVEFIPWSVKGTSDEGVVLRRWCQQTGVRSMIFVSTRDHSRRARRVLNRALRGVATQVTVRYSPYSEFDPDTWWLTRGGIRTELVELQKLLLDVLRHPLS